MFVSKVIIETVANFGTFETRRRGVEITLKEGDSVEEAFQKGEATVLKAIEKELEANSKVKRTETGARTK